MFKACFNNFLRNLKYVFIEVGFMYLALLLGFDLFFKRIGIGFDALKEAFSQLLETGEPTLLEEGFTRVMEMLAEGAAGFIAIQIAGLLVGFILMMVMMRSDVERRNIFKVLLNAIVDAIILAIFIAIIILISSAAEWGGIVVALYSIMTLFGSYVNHGMKAVEFKKAVSFRNMFKLAICDFIIILMIVGLAALIGLIFNAIIGLTLLVSLVMVGVCVISLNADSFVVSLVNEAKIDQKVADAKNEVIDQVIKEEKQEKEEQKAKEEAKKKEKDKPKEAEPESAKK